MQNIMTKTTETAAGETVENQHPVATETPKNAGFLQHPEIFEAHGLEWYRHDGSNQCPCEDIDMVDVLYKPPGEEVNKGVSIDSVIWGNEGFPKALHIIGWRPADAPAKLPRPGQQPQDAAKAIQTLTARVQELEGDLQHEIKLRETYEQACAICEKNPSTPTLRPIADPMPPVPEGCVRVFGGLCNNGEWFIFSQRVEADTHFLDIRIPTPPDPNEELRREFEAWMKGYNLQPDELAFQAYKAGRTKEGAR